MQRTISLSARRLSIRAGLGDLIQHPHCKGYANCCACSECAHIAALVLEHHIAGRNPFTIEGNLKPRPAPAQPWEAAA